MPYTINVDANFVMDLENALDPDDLNESRFSFVGKTYKLVSIIENSFIAGTIVSKAK